MRGTGTRALRSAVGVVLTIAFGVGGTIPEVRIVHAADPVTQVLADGMEVVSNAIGATTALGELAQAIPLTGVSPALSDGLDVLNTLHDTLASLNDATNAFVDEAPGAVADELEGLDTTTAGGVKIVFGCDGGSGCGTPVTVTETNGIVAISLPVSITKTISTPVRFQSSVVNLDGDPATVTLSASTTLGFTFDTTTATTQPQRAFAVAPFTVTYAAHLTGGPITASTRLGVADASATLRNLDVSLGLTQQFVDPDGVGGITVEELNNTTFEDLTNIGRTGSVAGTVEFDTDLIPGSPDSPQISIADGNLADGYSFTLPALTDLSPFTLITPEAIVAGLGQSAAALGGAQALTDPALPFLKGTLRRLVAASRPVLDVVDSLGVICGTSETDNGTPSGGADNLPSGSTVYCQATVTNPVQPGSVVWTAPNGTAGANTSGANANATIGLATTASATFVTTADGDFEPTVTYTAAIDEDNNPATAAVLHPNQKSQRPPRSVQQLAAKVAQLGGFDTPTDLVHYDPATKALTFHITKTFQGTEVSLPLDAGDQLEADTGIAGLTATAGGIKATAKDIAIDFTPGVLLLPEDQWDTVTGPGGCPDPSLSAQDIADGKCVSAIDLFFVKVRTGAGEHEFSVGDASFVVDPPPVLRGQLGYLAVEATVAGSPAFGISRSDTTKPVLSVDLVPTGDMTVDGTALPGAIRLRELLFHVADHVDVSDLNLKLSGRLTVAASLNGSEIAQANVDIAWDPVFTGSPTITPDANFDGLFANFNPVPNLFGSHTAGDSTTVLTNSTASFTDSAVGSTVDNVTDGSSCTVAVATATTLTCQQPLAGGKDNTWQSGDAYKVRVGSPLAMLEILLDNIDQITKVIQNLTGIDAATALDTKLPVVGISPREMLQQIDDLRRALAEIKGTGASVQCGLDVVGGQLSGDPSQVTLDNSGNGHIYCVGNTIKPALADPAPVWIVEMATGSTATASVVAPSTPENTVGSAPTEFVRIDFHGTAGDVLLQRQDVTGTDGTTSTVGYRVKVGWSDVDGAHAEEYPSLAQPNSIQKLQDAINEKLGVADAFGLSFDTGPGGENLVVLDLGILRCNDGTLCDGKSNEGPLFSSINAEVDGLGGLVSASSGGQVAVKYSAEARIKLGLELSGTPNIYVMPDTGIALKGRFEATDLDFDATLGPFSIKAGKSARIDDQGDSDPTNDIATGNGKVLLGADLTIGGAITSPVAIGTFLTNLGTYLTPSFTAPAGPDKVCGTVDQDSDPSTDPVEVSGLGCALISVGVSAGSVTNYVADLGLAVDLTGGNFTITPIYPNDLLAQFVNAALDLRLILNALPELIGEVRDGLRAGASSATGNGKVPLIGDALDAGADVADKLQQITTQLVQTIDPVVAAISDPSDIPDALRHFIYTQLSGTGLLQKPSGGAAAETDIEVYVDCGTGLAVDGCDGKALTDLKDVRVIFGIGQDEDYELPFDLGLDGVPLRLAGSLRPHVGWNFVVDLGLSRTEGPYIGVRKPTGTGSTRPDSELNLTAGVGFGADSAACSAVMPDPLEPLSGGSDPIIPGTWSEDRCLGGQLSFLGVQVRDGDGSGAKDTASHATINVGLDLSNGTADTLGFTNIGNVKLEPTVGVDAALNLRFRTGIAGDEPAGFPELVGTFHMAWNWAIKTPVTAPTVAFDDIYLNIQPLVSKFIEPIANEVRKITGPFKPVIDTLSAPIPVVSDLAEMVGQPPVTLLGLMQAISGNDLTLIQSLAAFIQFINDDKVADGYIPLGGLLGGGGFSVNGVGARLAQGPTEAAKLVQGAKAAAGSLFQQAPKQQTTGNLATSSSKTAPATKANLPGTFGVPGLTFPFMDNPSSIFGLLMGQDITLVRYDVGPLQASAGFSYNFPPIMVGPVPIAIGVGGSVTVKGRFVIGYDTSGLRKVLAGGSGVHLFDGIFLDDLDINGVDVPEISFIGEVYAQAGVSIAIASAGIVAGLRITVDLNLDDSPNPDGKLHIEEIFNKLSNPICLFDVKGSLTAFIKAYVELNLFITSLRYDFTLLELELLNFSGKCTPPAPKLAHWDGVKLVLNVGPYASQRNVDTENKDEEMTVRPAGGGRYSVSGFGLHQTYGPGGEFPSPDGYSVTIVEAHGGDGNDKFQMLPGTDESAPPTSTTNAENTSIPFTATALLYGDGDNDVLVGGDAVDTLDGGGGNDRIQGGKGGDHIAGGEGNDTLNGEAGNDDISGGGGDDQIQGGAGDDRADGGDGIDLLQGGPGTDTDPKKDPNATDGNDTLIGGAGPDTIEGGLGNDHLSGDAEELPTTIAECEGDTVLAPVDGVNYDDKISGGLGNDTVVGGLGNDELYGGAANDIVCGNQGNDKLDGDQNGDPKAGVPGDDIVAGGSGADVAVGGDGHDFVSGGSGSDSVAGQGGNDDVVGGTGRDLIRGGAGRDILAGDTASIDQSVSKATRGEPGDNTSLVSGIDATLDATAPTCTYDQATADGGDTAGRSDCLYGDDANDLIYGEGGNDAINAGEGDDLVYAGVGDDSPVHGDGGADTMYGEAGRDSIYGDSGSDVMYGNADADVMRGGSGDDLMEGNQAVDVMYGEGGQDDIIGGTSADGVSDGGDYIDGGASADVIVGDNGAITRPGGNDADDATSARRSVTVFDVGDPGVGGGDAITGGLANDRILGGNGDDLIWGESGVDRIEGDDGSDTISGGTEGDRIAGGTSSYATLVAADGSSLVAYDAAPDTGDLVDGDEGDDVLAGDDATIAWDGVATMTTTDLGTNYSDDTLHGDDGQDRVFGQLGDDVLTGDAGEDYVVGDLGSITAGAPDGFWPGGAPKWTVRLELSPDNGGTDTIDGGTADDHLYGGAADDVMAGGSGDDVMEGNGGQDTMYGWASGQNDLPDGVTDQDDMIGGSSQATRPGNIARADAGELVMEGNADHDVMIGDNGDITRVVAGTQWAPDEVISGAAKRTVTLLDRERADLTAVSGGDVMLGNTGSDRMFGEGGNDSVKGNEADDLLEGDQGSDWLEGNAGEDDLIGGSSFLASAGGLALAGSGADLGDPDDGDALFGGAGADVIAGDNAVVIRKTTANSAAYAAGLGSAYFTTDPSDGVPGWWLGVSTDRQVRLLDRSTFNSGRSGRDLVAGGAGADVAFGQDGGDWISGGANDDTLEGNGGSDRIVGDAAPALDGTGGEPLLTIPPAPGSPVVERDGAASPDGEDDIVGGSNVSHRDGSDEIAGNGEDDFVLGDNGTLQRNVVGGAYVRYAGDGVGHDRYMRRATRLDVNGAAGVFGNDTVRGNAGDDAVWAQDGNDTVYGGAGDDDLLGELGDDSIFGGSGEDAIVGDRGSVRNTELGAPGAQFSNPVYTFNSNGPPFITYTGFRAGTYDRRVDLMKELPGSVGGPFAGAAVNLAANGVTTGGSDRLRGGPGHDNLHGASGDDLMNGDSGGDTLFGGNGSDVMWGGRGNPNAATPDDRGTNDQYVDYLFGGRGGDPAAGFGVVTGGADIMDYLPRPGIDPDSWFETIAAYDDGESGGEALRQHHQGVDWFYGGWDRDVMESNLADNGPNLGDRAIDWTGSYNLYVQCPAANGGYNDQRVQSPAMISFEENLAYSLGVGANLAEVQNASSSAYNELAMVYKPDIKSNSGNAYPTTPGHFENPTACTNN